MIGVGKMESLTGQRNIAPMVIGMLQMVYNSIKGGNDRAASTILEETLSRISMELLGNFSFRTNSAENSKMHQTLSLRILQDLQASQRLAENQPASRTSLITGDAAFSEMIYTMLSNLITSIKMENPSYLSSISVPVFFRDKQEHLYKKEFPDCFAKICEIIRKNKAKSISKIGGDILDYLNKNPNPYKNSKFFS